MNASIRAALTIGLAAVLHAPLAPALSLVDTQTSGATVDTSFTAQDTIAADIAFSAPATPSGLLQVTLRFQLDLADITRGTAALNGIVDNVATTALATLRVSVDRGTVTPGSVLSNDGASSVVSLAPDTADITFVTPLVTFVELGNPLGSGQLDWTVGFAGLASGDTLAVTWTATPVPEPSAWLMLAGGLGLLATSVRRTRTRGR